MNIGAGILSCVREVDGRRVLVTNADSFVPGMHITVRRDDANLGSTEITKIVEYGNGVGFLTFWPKISCMPGDLVLFGGWTEESN